jgi:4-diphosphocytidyl-2-C-methyl-D-erythritol kinase
MILKSYAKINLILKVFPTKEKLHPILSVIDKIDLHDKLVISINKTGKLNVNFKNANIDNGNNTIIKVLKLLKDETNFKQGINITVYKNIPIAAGFGGGSSNAAVVLKYLNKKLNLRLSLKKLNDIAFRVGSDTPSFLIDGPVIISGYGEKVVKVKISSTSSFLIVKPKLGVSAKEAYGYFDQSSKISRKITDVEMKKLNNKNNIYKIMFNDLEQPVINSIKVVAKLYTDLRAYNFDKVIMTGSGSAFIAFSRSKKLLLLAKKELALKYDFVTISKRLKTR